MVKLLVGFAYAVSVVASFVVLVHALWDGRWVLAAFALAVLVLAVALGSRRAPQ